MGNKIQMQIVDYVPNRLQKQNQAVRLQSVGPQICERTLTNLPSQFSRHRLSSNFYLGRSHTAFISVVEFRGYKTCSRSEIAGIHIRHAFYYDKHSNISDRCAPSYIASEKKSVETIHSNHRSIRYDRSRIENFEFDV
jgi:hypothetical protein